MSGHYFIRIDNAKDLRRKVLESSKGSLHILRRYQELLKIRGEKQTLMKSLRNDLKELTVLVNVIEDSMPTLTQSELNELGPHDLPALDAGKKKKGGKKKNSRKKVKRKNRVVQDDGKKVYLGIRTEPPLQKVAKKKAPIRKRTTSVVREPVLDLKTKLDSIERRLGGL
jgi:hypothetical protein